MRIKKIVPIILLCALLTSCTIARREEDTATYEGTESIEYTESSEPLPIIEKSYWNSFSYTVHAEQPDNSFASEPGEDAAKYLDEIIEHDIASISELYPPEFAEQTINELRWYIMGTLQAPSENGVFLIKRYGISMSNSEWSEIYFIPEGGEPRLIKEIDSELPDEVWIAGGSHVYCAERHSSTLYRISEEGVLDSLELPVREGYRYSSVCEMDEPDTAGELTLRVRDNREEGGLLYLHSAVYTVNAETLEIIDEQINESADYWWQYVHSSSYAPYDYDFESMISDSARQYFESEKEKAAPLTAEEEAEWDRIYTMPVGIPRFNGWGGFVIKTYGLYNLPEKKFYEIYLFESGSSEYTLLHTMTDADNGGSIWGTMCDGARLYFVYRGELCCISSEGEPESVLPLDRYDGWELYRSDTEFTGDGNMLRASICYRCTDPETGEELRRRDMCAVNIDTLQITGYIEGEITPPW